MELIFQGKFKGFTGIEHTVNIYDKDDASISPEVQELILQAPGYTISYSTDISNIVKTGIIKSEIKLIIQNPDGILNDFLNDLGIYENKFLVEVLQDDVPYWRGIILSDFGNIGDGKYNAVQLSGTDGTGLLADEDVLKIDPNKKSSLGRYIIEGLAKLPTADFFTIDSFLKIKTDWRSVLMNDSIIRDPLMMVSAGDYATDKFMWQTYSKRIGYNGSEVIEIKYMDYKTVISHILTRFNAVLFMYKGAWCILQRDLLELSTSIDLFQYNKIGQMLTTGLSNNEPDYYTLVSNVEINQSDNYRAQGSFDFLPGLKSVEVSYLGNLSNGESNPSLMSFSWAPSSVPNGRDADYWYLVGHSSQGGIGTWTSPKLYTGSGNYIATNIKWRDVYEIHQTGTWNVTAFCFVEIKLVGTSNTYYLRRYPNATTGVIEHKWTLTPVKIMISPCDGIPLGITQQINTFTTGSGQSTAPVYNDSLAFSLDIPNSQDIPEDGNITITIERGDLISTTSIYNPLGFTPATAFEPEWISTGYTNFNFPNEDWLSYFFYFIINNEAPSESIYFKVNNDVDGFSLVNTLEDSLLGSAGSSATGLLEVWDGTAWISPFTTANKYWAKGDVSIYGLYFNQLLIDEVLANQIHPLLCFNGLLINRTNTPIHPVQSISILYNGSSYRLHLRNVTYNPYAEEWSGDWFEISRVKRMTVAPGDPIALPMPLINNQAGANSATQIIATALFRLDILQVTNDAITVDDHILNIDGVGLQTKPHPAIIPSIGILQQAVGHRIIQTDNAGTRTPIDGNDLVIYGYLYNYYALANIANTTDGWRVPSAADFAELVSYIQTIYPTETAKYVNSIRKHQTAVPGGETQVHPYWSNLINIDGLDTFNLFLIPGGFRISIAPYLNDWGGMGSYCFLWCSDQYSASDGKSYRTRQGFTDFIEEHIPKYYGVSIRLVRDASSIEIGLADGTYVEPYVGNDGKTYVSVKIGNQIWTAENLAETKYDDGSLIDYTTKTYTQWAALTTGARCSYYDNPNFAIYRASIKEISSDTDTFEGIGTADAPLALLNAEDDIIYGIKNGKYEPIPASAPGGNDTEVQFNDAETFAGDSTFKFNKTSKEVAAQTISITRDIKLSNTTNASKYGVIQKNGKRFIHDFNYGNNGSVTTEGKNIFIGEEAGNYTMGGAVTSAYKASYNIGIGNSTLNKNTDGERNVGIGSEALVNNTTGYHNVALGTQSLYSNVAGFWNVGVGTQSLYSNTAYGNTAIGYRALVYNSSGYYNVAIGYEAIGSNTVTGGHNVGIGIQTIYSNTSGLYNVGISSFALYSNTAGQANLSIGYYSMFSNKAGSYGVAIGYESQQYVNNTTTPWTNSNVSIGYNSLRGSTTAANNTGNHNVAIGYNSMLNTSTGENNMAIGSQTMASNTTGSKNVALGFYSLFANTTGQQNIAIGHQALSNNQVHSSNVAIGTQALYNTVQSANIGIGVEALYANTSGYYNIAIGQAAGRFITGGSNPNQTGTYSLFIGAETKAKADGETNQIVIGYNATGLGSNTVVLGNSSITITRLQGSVGIGTNAPAAKLQVIGDCRFGSATDYTEFENDGTRHAVGAATTWRDELNNLVGQKLESPSSDIVTNYTECTLDFKTSAKYGVDFAFMNIQINHDWLIGTQIFPHLHWIQEEEFTPNWIISYRWQINGETKQTAWTPLIWNTNVFSWVSGSLNQISTFSSIEPPPGAGLSDILQIKLHRDTNNDSLGFGDIDNYTLTAQAYSFDIHIECDTDGSRSEYSK